MCICICMCESVCGCHGIHYTEQIEITNKEAPFIHVPAYSN